MRVLKNNKLFIALFFGGIIIPTAILAILSFRNIQNEKVLAEKKLEDSQTSFQKQVADAVKTEQNAILQETKTASQFLYEQPQKLLEFGNAVSFKNVKGVSAIFLFNGNKLIYPSIPIQNNISSNEISTVLTNPIEKELLSEELAGRNLDKIAFARSALLLRSGFSSKEDKIFNLLGLIRFYYNKKQYTEALKIIDILERHPESKGYLQANLTGSLKLLKFEILVAQNRHSEAETYCLSQLSFFLDGHENQNLGSAKFFFDNTISKILSFEDLPRNMREAFWNLRENLNRQLAHAEILYEHEQFLKQLATETISSKNGILYQKDNQFSFFRMSYPWLSGDQIVIGMIDKKAYRKRLLSKISDVAREWRTIPYTISNEVDSILSGKIPDSATIIAQKNITEGLNWTLTLYQKNYQDLYSETRHKMFLLYGLVAFSLLTVILGSIFVFRSLSEERKLLFMKSNFLSSVSHELKTPLTSIKMFAEMISKGRVQKIEKCQEYSALIGKESSRLENLIGAILNYTRMESGKQVFHWEKIDLSICVAKVFEATLDIADNRGISMTKDLADGSFVMGDYTALYSLAQNLIENAIKYTNPPGKVSVKVSSENEKIVFSVTDTGIGIASSEQKNIFNDFYRVGDEMTRSTKGSGLGLAIVKRVAEAHKANISLKSHPGTGSTFTVRIKKAE